MPKLPQLSLRDLFWLVLACALGVAWWVEHRQRVAEAEEHAHDRDMIRSLQQMTQSLMDSLNQQGATPAAPTTDYSGILVEVVEGLPEDRPADSP
jgi:hypothetical protein